MSRKKIKVKLKNLKKLIPMYNSYCDLNTKDWERLNLGRIVWMFEIPKLAKEYLMEVKNGKS